MVGSGIILKRSRSKQRQSFLFSIMIHLWMILPIFIFSFSLTSCSNNKSKFPTVPQTVTATTTGKSVSVETSAAQSSPISIRLAAPLSEETAEYLAKLYTAKKNDMLGVGITGQTVSTAFLDTIKTEISVEVISTALTGANLSAYQTWIQSGMTPDVLLTDNVTDLMERGYLASVDDIMAGNALLSPANVYPDMIDQFMIEGQFFGIPYYASVSIIFINNEVLNSAGFVLPFEADTDAILEAATLVSLLNEDREDPGSLVIPMYSGTELLPFLPPSFDSDVGYMAEHAGKIDVDSEGFRDSVQFLRKFDTSFSVSSMSREERETVFGTFDPITSKRVAMWVGRSDEIARWSNYMPFTLGIAQIPSQKAGTLSRPALTVFPLCVSSQSDHPVEAASFAAFIALDPDAILLRQRFENHEGFIPVVKSNDVWDQCFSNAKYCGSFYKYKGLMSEAYFCPFVSDPVFDDQTEAFLKRYADIILDKAIDINELFDTIKKNIDEEI